MLLIGIILVAHLAPLCTHSG